eukprot:11784847-Heterocapsa_arctica.AAC.1
MLPHFRAAFLEALGLPGDSTGANANLSAPQQARQKGGGKGHANNEEAIPRAQGHAPVIDAARFSVYPRARVFASTLNPATRHWNSLPPRPCPWEAGWERRSKTGSP